MDRNFGGVIWTNHALDKLRERGIKQGDAWATWSSPEQSRKANIPGAWIYFKSSGNERIEVVAKQDEKKRWVILSVWNRSINGNKRESSEHLSFWKLIVKQILGK